MNILTLNKSVFSGKTKTTKRKKLTEKSIKSELVIPDSAVELSYEEMEYIDGGFFIGLKASPSTAVFVYERIGSTINNLISNGGDGSQTLQGLIGLFSLTTFTAIVTSYITAAWTSIISAITGNPIIAFVAAIGVISAATWVAGYSGSKGRGFRIGLEIGWFKIRGVAELI